MALDVCSVDVPDIPSVLTEFAGVGEPVCHHHDVRVVVDLHGGIVFRGKHDSVLDGFHGFIIEMFLLTPG